MDNLRNKKIIVAHAGQQHSFKVASALKKENILFKYITTVYNKKNSITSKLEIFLNGDNLKRSQGRRCYDLDDGDVKQINEWMGLLFLLIIRIDKSKKVWNLWNKVTNDYFGKRVAKYAIKNNVDAVIMYDSGANKCFEILAKKAPNIKRIIDMSATNISYMKRIYEEDIEKGHKFSTKLKKEVGFYLDEKNIQTFINEIELAQEFIVASNFVKNSLMFSNVDEKNIHICPYGVDTKKFNSKLKKNRDSNELRCIYIGNVTQMKGIYYLLEAISKFDKSSVKLTLIGDFDNSDNHFSSYMERCEFLGKIPHDDINKFLNEADIMIFPSLGEGFGLAAIEGLASGLPLICTENSAINDIIINEYNGFVIKTGSIDEIADKIKWFIENRDKLNYMSKNATNSIEQYNWNNYEKKLLNAMDKILG